MVMGLVLINVESFALLIVVGIVISTIKIILVKSFSVKELLKNFVTSIEDCALLASIVGISSMTAGFGDPERMAISLSFIFNSNLYAQFLISTFSTSKRTNASVLSFMLMAISIYLLAECIR
jgi:hypothetical protein